MVAKKFIFIYMFFSNFLFTKKVYNLKYSNYFHFIEDVSI